MPLIASGVIAGVNALTKGVIGGSQIHQSNKLRKEAGARPLYSIQDEYLNNQSLAENMSQTGLTQQAKDFYTSSSERGLSAGIGATLEAGGNPNSIARLYDSYDNNLAKITAEDSQLKNENLKYLMAVNKDLAGQKTIQWSLNKLDPWKDKMQASAEAKNAGLKNITGALSDATSAAASFSIADNYKSMSANPGATSTITNPAPALPIDIAAPMGKSQAQIKAEQDLLKLYPNSPYLKNLYPVA